MDNYKPKYVGIYEQLSETFPRDINILMIEYLETVDELFHLKPSIETKWQKKVYLIKIQISEMENDLYETASDIDFKGRIEFFKRSLKEDAITEQRKILEKIAICYQNCRDAVILDYFKNYKYINNLILAEQKAKQFIEDHAKTINKWEMSMNTLPSYAETKIVCTTTSIVREREPWLTGILEYKLPVSFIPGM